MTRRAAYIATRKFKFSEMVLEGAERRKAYAIASKFAAEYVFRASSHSLNYVFVPVWNVTFR